MNQLIQEILKNGFILEVGYNNETETYQYSMQGFYKSGGIQLIEDGEKLIVIARYDEQTIIEKFDDLVYLNYNWWQYSKDRYTDWSMPDDKWFPFMLKLNLNI